MISGLNSNWHLGEILVRAGFVPNGQIEQLLNVEHTPPARLGQLLVLSGHLSADELQAALKVQSWLRDRRINKMRAIAALKVMRSRRLSLESALEFIDTTISAPSDNLLGGLLVSAGAISDLQLQDGLERSRTSGLPLGTVLSLSENLPPHVLAAALEAQEKLRTGQFKRDEAASSIRALIQEAQTPSPSIETTRPASPRELFAELLESANLLSPQTLDSLSKQAEIEGISFIDSLLRSGAIDKALLDTVEESVEWIQSGLINRQTAISYLSKYAKPAPIPAGPSQPKAPLPNCAKPGKRDICQPSPTGVNDCGDFMVVCNFITAESKKRAKSMIAGTNKSLTEALLIAGVVSEMESQLAGLCYSLVQRGVMSLDEAVFAADFCKREILAGADLYQSIIALADQTGIVAPFKAVRTDTQEADASSTPTYRDYKINETGGHAS